MAESMEGSELFPKSAQYLHNCLEIPHSHCATAEGAGEKSPSSLTKRKIIPRVLEYIEVPGAGRPQAHLAGRNSERGP